MEIDVNKTMRSCHSRAKAGTTLKHKCYHQRFPAMGPLEFVAMDVLDQLPKPAKGIRSVVNITGRLLKLTEAVPTAGNTTSPVDHIYLHIDNCTQFVSKGFGTLRTHLVTKHMRTTVYHL